MTNSHIYGVIVIIHHKRLIGTFVEANKIILHLDGYGDQHAKQSTRFSSSCY
jgi:hypothetical protein